MKLGDQCIGVDADVSKIADLQKLVDAAVAKFGRLDVMVNNAGIETRTSILDTTEEQYDAVLDINLKSAFFATQLAAKQMISQGVAGESSISPRCMRIGRCQEIQHTAFPRAECAC